MTQTIKLGVKAVFILFIFFFVCKASVFATAPTINSFPVNINVDTSFTVIATMSGLTSNKIYRLRLALAQSGTSNYFGSTYNGSSWYNGTPSPINYANFLSITTSDNGSWSGDILGMIELSDPNLTTGSGTYDLKVGRYTETGTSATWSDPASISLIVPTPVPTNTPIPTNTPVPTVTSVPTFVPTNTPTPTKPPATPTIKPTPQSVTITPNPTITVDVQATSSSESVLAVTTENSTFPAKQEKKELIASTNAENNISKIFIGIGILLLAACGILAFNLIDKIKQFIKR